MTTFGEAYWDCMASYPDPPGGLSDDDYCQAQAWLLQPSVSVFPVGDRTLPVFIPSLGLPGLASPSPPNPQVSIPEPVDRRDEPPHTSDAGMNGAGELTIIGAGASPNTTRVMKGKIIYTILTTQIEAIRNRPYMSNEVPTSGGLGPGTPPYQPPIVQDEDTGVSTIIDAIVDLGTAYFQGQSGGVVPMALAAPGGSVVVGGVAPGMQGPALAPCAPIRSKQIWDPNANCGAGKWITRRKRRRERLATASDIKDIAALREVLGPKAMQAWIATH